MKKRIFSLVVASTLAGLIGIWFFTRDTLPKTIEIATARPGGMYYRFGKALKEKLQQRIDHGHEILLHDTSGTLENIELLKNDKVHFALLEFVLYPNPNDNISIITPLYHEPALILAKKELAINSVFDLQGRPVCVWPKGSGMEKTTEMLLDFYDQDIERVEKNCFAEQDSWDAAFAVFGLLTPSLQKMVQTGDYKIIGLPVTKALAASYAFPTEFTVPKGIFARKPHLLPAHDIQTVAYTTFLAGNNGENSKKKADPVLVNEVLDAIYSPDLHIQFPMLMSQEKAKTWSRLPLHPTAMEYFEPYRKIGVIANFMESLAAVKELFFAFAAACYFLWLRVSELRKKKERDEVARMKEQLDDFLKITMEADRKQMQSTSREELIHLMQQVTEVKLQALTELTHERLRSDQMFSIFLMQCHNVIVKIQVKIGILN
ncbi:hypothetical protein GCAAIG_06395 [Candidatus Electronema halotolerans]